MIFIQTLPCQRSARTYTNIVMTSPTKKVCLVQLNFDCDSSDGTIFTKKVRICGFPLPIDNPSTAYVKEINYPHPHNLKRTGSNQNNTCSKRQFANLSYPRIDLDLANSLDKFDYIIVNNSESAEFISYYIKTTTTVINIEEAVQVIGDIQQQQYQQQHEKSHRRGDIPYTQQGDASASQSETMMCNSSLQVRPSMPINYRQQNPQQSTHMSSFVSTSACM